RSDKLTRRTLESWIKTAKHGEWLWCQELRGFGAHRREAGTAAFVVQFRVGRGRMAKRRRVVLGEHPAMPLEQARMLAADHVSAGWRGIDQVAENRIKQAVQAQQRERLDDLVIAFHAARRSHLKVHSAKQYQSIWRRLILPDLGSKPVPDIKRRDVA